MIRWESSSGYATTISEDGLSAWQRGADADEDKLNEAVYGTVIDQGVCTFRFSISSNQVAEAHGVFGVADADSDRSDMRTAWGFSAHRGMLLTTTDANVIGFDTSSWGKQIMDGNLVGRMNGALVDVFVDLNARTLAFSINSGPVIDAAIRLPSKVMPWAFLITTHRGVNNGVQISGQLPATLGSTSGHQVFVSFRFTEAHSEAMALKHALEARGLPTFVCNEEPGADLQDAIATALTGSKVQVLLATRTYGKKTSELFSTRQEMNYALGQGNPFLIKMCDEWEDPATRVALGEHTMWTMWTPGSPMPGDLVDRILATVARR